MYSTKPFNYNNKAGYLFTDIELKSPYTPSTPSNIQISFNLNKQTKNKVNDFQYETFLEKKNAFSSNLNKPNFYKTTLTSHSNDNRSEKVSFKKYSKNNLNRLDKLNNSFEDKNTILHELNKTPKHLDNFHTFSPKGFVSTITTRNIISKYNESKPNKDLNLPLKTNYDLKSFESSKFSFKSHGLVRGYAANTNQGIVRDYNEDRVSIILNIVKPLSYKGASWPNISFFGIYDGHGGNSCSDFLRDNLHQYIIKDSHFPIDPKRAIMNGFELAEKEFLEKKAQFNGRLMDRSGSCAIVLLIIDEMGYVANVGDSRAIISIDQGRIVNPLSKDHKPDYEEERRRIIANGGKVYQQKQNIIQPINFGKFQAHNTSVYVGPYRVYPGRLSVSRTFGDVEAKYKAFGGLPNVVIANPDINCFKIKENMDFIVIGSDGIFDQMSNEDVSKCVWQTIKQSSKGKNLHSICGESVDVILKTSLAQKSLDNVTCLLIALPNLEKTVGGNISDIIEGKEDTSQKFSQIKNDYLLKTEQYNEKAKEFSLKNNYLDDMKRQITNQFSGNQSTTPNTQTMNTNKTSAYFYKPFSTSKDNKTNHKDFSTLYGKIKMTKEYNNVQNDFNRKASKTLNNEPIGENRYNFPLNLYLSKYK